MFSDTLVCLSIFSGWDEQLQGCVLLHALCPGCIRMAHVPNEKTCLWALSSCQLLPVSRRAQVQFWFTWLSVCVPWTFSMHEIVTHLPSANPLRVYRLNCTHRFLFRWDYECKLFFSLHYLYFFCLSFMRFFWLSHFLFPSSPPPRQLHIDVWLSLVPVGDGGGGQLLWL